MSLTIVGAHGHDVWIELGGDFAPLTRADLHRMSSEVRWFGTTFRFGVLFDEADVTALTKAADGPQLDDCADCDGPGLHVVEGRTLCPGHLAGFGAAEDAAMEASA